MNSLAFNADEANFSGSDGAGASLARLRHRAQQAKRWLEGAAQEIVIGWFAGRYGLPAPAALMRVPRDEEDQVAAPVRVAEAEQMPAEMQWAMTTEVFFAAASRADLASRMHAAASEQIDAASYVLDEVREEIGPLMIFSREDQEEQLIVRRYTREEKPYWASTRARARARGKGRKKSAAA